MPTHTIDYAPGAAPVQDSSYQHPRMAAVPLASHSHIESDCLTAFCPAPSGDGMASENYLRRIRSLGVRGILIYCADYKCSHRWR
jgi:hypothetical protein